MRDSWLCILNIFYYNIQKISGTAKLLVGLGLANEEATNSIEIIDLASPSRTCKNLPNFPSAFVGSFGGLGFKEKPIICGGVDGGFSNKCFSLDGNEWISSPSLNTPRLSASVSPSPYPSKSQKFFVTGGYDDSGKHLNTLEVLTEQGWETLPQKLPLTIPLHCSVLVNSTTLMLIGGWQNSELSSKTYYFNTEDEIWTEGPQLKNERYWHSCGRIRKNSQSEEFSIIVAGGFQGFFPILSSVEILDSGSNEWRKGPELPIGILSSQMVEDSNGGVVLVGGDSDSEGYLDTLFQLSHGGEDAKWIEMEQKLKIARKGHVAFLVPDNIVDCS